MRFCSLTSWQTRRPTGYAGEFGQALQTKRSNFAGRFILVVGDWCRSINSHFRSMRVAAYRPHSLSDTTIDELGKEIGYLAKVVLHGIDGSRKARVRLNTKAAGPLSQRVLVDQPVKSQRRGAHCDDLRNKPRSRISPESPSGSPGFTCSNVCQRRLAPSRTVRPRTTSPFLPLVTRSVAVLPVAIPSTVPSPPSFRRPHPPVAIECSPVILSPFWTSVNFAEPHSASASRSARVRKSICHSPVKGCSADAEPNTTKLPHAIFRIAQVIICDLMLS